MIGEGNMTFDEDGISMTGMDQSHVCLLRTSLPAQMLREGGGEYVYSGEDAIVGVPYKVISTILGTFSGAKSIHMGVDPSKDSMDLRVVTGDGTSRFVVKMMDLEEDAMDIPEMEYDVCTDVPFKTLQKAFGQAESLDASVVNFVRSPDMMRLRYQTDTVDADVVLHTDTHVGSPSETSVAATYPKRLLAAGQMSTNVRISFTKDLPIQFMCKYDDSPTSGFTELYVAPRIDDEDDEATEDDDYQNYRD